uniref:Uncharacterized protein n=1 Tax=Poecilia reticulata TaxID=8081 RepID=A0A3P9PEB0_POERE
QDLYLIPLFADQAAGEQGLRIQPPQQVEGQLEGKETQEIPFQQRLQAVGQVTELGGAAQRNELIQTLVTLLVAKRKEGGRDRLQPPLKGRFVHGHMTRFILCSCGKSRLLSFPNYK